MISFAFQSFSVFFLVKVGGVLAMLEHILEQAQAGQSDPWTWEVRCCHVYFPRLSVGKVVAMSMCLLLVEFEFTRRRQPRSKLWKMRMLPSRTMKHWPKRPLQVWQQKRKRHESEIPTSTNIHHSAQEFDPSQHDLLNRLCWGWQCGGSHHQSRGATSQHLSILFDRVWRSYDLIYGYLSRLVNDRSMTLAS